MAQSKLYQSNHNLPHQPITCLPKPLCTCSYRKLLNYSQLDSLLINWIIGPRQVPSIHYSWNLKEEYGVWNIGLLSFLPSHCIFLFKSPLQIDCTLHSPIFIHQPLWIRTSSAAAATATSDMQTRRTTTSQETKQIEAAAIVVATTTQVQMATKIYP